MLAIGPVSGSQSRLQNFWHPNQFAQITETKLIGIRMAYRYEPKSVETQMAGGPYMGEPAPNRG